MSSNIALGDLDAGNCTYDDVVLEHRCPDMVLLCRTCDTNCKRPVLLFEHCKTEHGRMPTREERTPVCTEGDEVQSLRRRYNPARGEAAGNSKLTDQSVREIRETVALKTRKKQDIAADYGISPGCLSNIISGRTWSHVT